MAENGAATRSILAVDFGSVHTRVILIDVVDGTYRMVSRSVGRTTDGFPVYDLEVGLQRQLRRLTELTGRRLLDRARSLITPERDDGAGVDFFALSASIGRPLRAVVVGLVPDMSIASAQRAVTGTYIDVVSVISLDDGRNEEDRLNALLLALPDVILLTGGTEDGAESTVTRSVELVRLALHLTDSSARPSVIYAGNNALTEHVREKLEPLTSVFVADNVRPRLEVEDIDGARAQMARAFDRYQEQRHPSLAEVGARSQTGIMPSAQGHVVAAEYLASRYKQRVAVLDVGSGSSTLAACIGGETKSTIRTDLGLGHAAQALTDTLGLDAVRAWIPFYVGDSELMNYTMNKTLRPGSIPITRRELYLERALLLAAVQQMIHAMNLGWRDEPPRLDRLVVSGAALTQSGTPGYDVLLALDAVQPDGITRVEADPYGLVPAVGALAGQMPGPVVQLLEEGATLPMLGTVINVGGSPRLDKPALNIRIEPLDDDGPVIKDTVPGGHLWVYRLPAGKRARVKLRCRGGLRIGGKRRMNVTVEGGALGIVFDARGRSLPIGMSPEERAAQFPLWLHEISGEALEEIDPRWLEPEPARQESPAAGEPEDENDARPKKRRRRRGRRQQDGDTAQQDEAEATDKDELDELRDVLS